MNQITISTINAITPPPPPRYFIGRKQLIEDIIAEITPIGVPAPRIAIQGMGGVGKTALVTQIAEKVKSNFPGGIFWGNELPSDDANPSIILKYWGTLCGQSLETENESNLPSSVLLLLHARKEKLGSILIIVDDVRLEWTGGGIKAIEQALPIGTPLIITTRQTRPTQDIDAKIYNLNVLSRVESCQLLISLSQNKISDSQAEIFSELCGDMPLALELMAKLTKTKKSDSLLNRLQSEANRLDMIKLDEASRKEHSVQISMDISYRELAEHRPETARIFRYLAAFAKPVFIVYKHLVDSLTLLRLADKTSRNMGNALFQPEIGGPLSQSQQTISDYENAVFVSYAWGGKSETMVDDLERAFAERGIRITRDKRDIEFRGSIKEFEDRIGMGQCVVLVISDRYLRSEHCMYELLTIEENKKLRERIFPIVIQDAQIYGALGRLKYIKYWEKKIKQLDKSIKQIDRMNSLESIHRDLDIYDRIRDNFDHLADILRDMNALTPELHAASGFSTLINSVEKVIPGLQTPDKAQSRPVAITNMSLNQRVRNVEDDLQRLVDWSLLMEDREIEGSEMDYFRMHSLLHEYAQSFLFDKAEMEDAIQNHIRYCVAFAKANPHIDLQKRHRSTFEFERSYGQLLKALDKIKERYMPVVENWGDHLELAEQIMVLVDALDNHWQLHSQHVVQTEWLPMAYKCAGALGRTTKQADFARRMGRVLFFQGELDHALEWMNRSEEALGGDGSEEANGTRALIYIHRAAVIYLKGETDLAKEDCLRGLDLVDAKKQPRVYAEGQNLLGVIEMMLGNLFSALEALEKSLTVWNQIGDQYQISRVKDNRRNVLYYLGRFTDLRKEEDASLKYWEQFPDRIELAYALTNRGLVHQVDGEFEAAIDLHQRAMKLSDRLVVPRMQAMIRTNIAGPYISLEKYDEAEAYLKKSMEIRAEHNIEEYSVDAQRSLAEAALEKKHYEQAVSLAEQALEFAREDNDPLEIGAALRTLGQAFCSSGSLESAQDCLEESLTLLRGNEFIYESYLTLLAFPKLYEAMGETEKAQAIAEEARSLAKEMGIKLPRA